MAKKYHVGFVRRTINKLVARQVAKGKGSEDMYLLTTLGRKSKQERTTPVTIARRDGVRYLVAPYGSVGWVHNLRESGLAELSRGGTREEISVTEVDAATAAPVLKQYYRDVKVTRPFFDVGKEATVPEFEVVADRHPVFRVNI